MPISLVVIVLYPSIKLCSPRHLSISIPVHITRGRIYFLSPARTITHMSQQNPSKTTILFAPMEHRIYLFDFTHLTKLQRLNVE
ncbi:hypothetical protein BJ165DRAFT_1483780 [Panaeolus papilionaceus]|nr:hypothetical protein BJ165DRAFT_1483780 [Panaeolus papilionaceus]